MRGFEESGVGGDAGTQIEPVVVTGEGMTIDAVVRVARRGGRTRLTNDPAVLDRIHRSREIIQRAVDAGEAIYGVTTAFGGMANIHVAREQAAALQNNIPWPHKTGAGGLLPEADVRAAMLLRANSLMRGASGVRLEIIQRLVDFLNAGATPHVHEYGSIGASGDLVPLAYILGAVAGTDPCFRVSLGGEELDAATALRRLDLPPLPLGPKEGLSVMNGTSVMAGIAALRVHDTQALAALAMGAHALCIQGLGASDQSFHPYIQRQKPHPGQIWSAERMVDLLSGSALIRGELDGTRGGRGDDLVQDRYSLRCLPQYMGPIADGMAVVASQVAVEMNAATDNPLIDPESGSCLYCGNFLGQYIGMGMDQLRHHIGLMAKHLDVQIALLVSPEFSNGLPPSLVGNPDRRVNLGLKGLQISANSVMPVLSFLGAPFIDRYPTHAEQFNQNVNSLGFGSANLARQSVDAFRQYMAMALIFGVQAVDLRTRLAAGHWDARKTLSPATLPLYEAVLGVAERAPSADRPYLFNDDERPLDRDIRRIADDIARDGAIPQAVEAVWRSLRDHRPY